MTAGIVLPVKRFDGAKHRLSVVLAPEQRRRLMEAMVADVLAAVALVRVPHVFVVVTSEPAVARAAARVGATVVADTREPGHSPAAARGVAVAVALGASPVLLLPGDCPLLDPWSVDGLLAGASSASPRVALVSDRAGDGTNALLLDPPKAIDPAFGLGSRERHRRAALAAGARFDVVDVPSLRLDVDTPDDLAALTAALAVRTAAARQTAGVLSALAPAPQAAG